MDLYHNHMDTVVLEHNGSHLKPLRYVKELTDTIIMKTNIIGLRQRLTRMQADTGCQWGAH